MNRSSLYLLLLLPFALILLSNIMRIVNATPTGNPSCLIGAYVPADLEERKATQMAWLNLGMLLVRVIFLGKYARLIQPRNVNLWPSMFRPAVYLFIGYAVTTTIHDSLTPCIVMITASPPTKNKLPAR